MKIIFTTLGLIVAVTLLLPSQAHAFLATSTVVIVATSAAPFVLGFFIILAANSIVFYKRIPHRPVVFGIVGVSVVLLGVLGFFAFNRFQELQVSNTTGAETSLFASDDERWLEFVSQVESSDEIDPQRKVLKPNGEYCVRRGAEQSTRLDNDQVREVIENESRHIIDVSCPTITVKNGTKSCGLSWDIFTQYDNEEAVQAALSQYGVEPGDDVLLLCEFGVTTSHLAFILNHYGYNAGYSAIVDLDEDLIENPDNVSMQEFTVLTDTFEYADDDQYVYFFVNDRDRDLFYETNPRNDLEYIDNYTLINASGLPLEYEEDAVLEGLVESEETTDSLEISDYKIVCKNKLHCFFTRHYLYSKDITDFDTVYCKSCKEERTITYCDEE